MAQAKIGKYLVYLSGYPLNLFPYPCEKTYFCLLVFIIQKISYIL
jgi:hypothetical protein